MEVEFLSPFVSDHSPSLITIKEDLNTGPKPFKFRVFWMKHQKFKGVMQQRWDTSTSENSMRSFCLKLIRLKDGLKEFDKEFYSFISCREKLLKAQLELIKGALQLDPCYTYLQKAKREAIVKYADMVLFEEMLAKDKARIQLHESDRNTGFFPRTNKSHQARNRILTLKDSNGTRITEYDAVKDHAVAFFQSIFTENY
ncbi:hypothetical protein ACH5RR_026152 [Cinchona calisaya]|uniref:Uncharacterized protein n=1 Tax=Cinchona calisaya TaxID=153742 RepID=A0ABD2Z546_9GENT